MPPSAWRSFFLGPWSVYEASPIFSISLLPGPREEQHKSGSVKATWEVKKSWKKVKKTDEKKKKKKTPARRACVAVALFLAGAESGRIADGRGRLARRKALRSELYLSIPCVHNLVIWRTARTRDGERSVFASFLSYWATKGRAPIPELPFPSHSKCRENARPPSVPGTARPAGWLRLILSLDDAELAVRRWGSKICSARLGLGSPHKINHWGRSVSLS